MWTLIRKSIYDPIFYEELREQPFSYSVKYYISLTFVIGAIAAAMYAFFITPVAIDFVQKGAPSMVERLPDDFLLVTKNGELRINPSGPVAIPLTGAVNEIWGGQIETDNIIVFDTEASPVDISDMSTLLLVTGDSIVSILPDGGYQAIGLSSFDIFLTGEYDIFLRSELVLTKESIAGFIERLKFRTKYFGPVILLALFIAQLFFFSMRLIPIMIAMFFVLMLLRRYGKKGEMSYATKIALHASTTPAIAESLLWAGGGSGALVFGGLVVFGAWLNIRPNARRSVGALVEMRIQAEEEKKKGDRKTNEEDTP